MIGARLRRGEPVLAGVGGILGGVVLFSTFVNLLALTVPLYMMQAFDRVLNSGSLETLAMLTLVAVGCLAAMAGFDVIRLRLLARASARLEYEIGPRVLEGTLLHAGERGQVRSSQPMRDLQEVRAFLVSPGFIAIVDAPWVPLYLLVLSIMHPLLGAVAILGAILLALLAILGERIGRAPLREAREAGIQAGRRAQAFVQHADVVRAMGLAPSLKARWLGDVDGAFGPMAAAADRAGAITALARTLRQMLQIATIGVGVLLVIANQLTAGVLSAALLLIARGLAPLEQAIAAWRSLVSAREALSRVRETLSVIPPQKRWLPDPEGQLAVEGVVVLGKNSPRPLLGGVSLKVSPGETVAIIGPSGAGKSTLARVIVGLERPVRGRVRLDGADLESWPLEQLGRHVGYLPQNVGLFEGTVAENIAGMEPDPDPYDVLEAAVAAGAHDMILELPGGYGAEVGGDGELLSAGQRQRIGLARAFYGARKLLVLDEPNSNLDASGDAALIGAIKAARERGCATLIITHRRDVLGVVDRIVSLKGGVVEGHARPVQTVAPAPEIRKTPPAPVLEQPERAAAAPVPEVELPSSRTTPEPKKTTVIASPPTIYISHAADDSKSAHAIAGVLERAGHRVAVGLPDIGDRAAWAVLTKAIDADSRVLALVTPRYLQDRKCKNERLKMLAADPLDAKGRMIVLRAGAPDVLPGVMGALPFWDLTPAKGQAELQARIIRAAAGDKYQSSGAGVLAYRSPARSLLHANVRSDPRFVAYDRDLMAIDGALWSGGDAGVVLAARDVSLSAGLAREYAWQARDGFGGIWWIDARDSEHLVRGLVELGAELRPRPEGDDAEVARRTLDLICSDVFAKPWLIVLAGPVDPLLLAMWRPYGNARVLVTCRKGDPALGLPILEIAARPTMPATAHVLT